MKSINLIKIILASTFLILLTMSCRTSQNSHPKRVYPNNTHSASWKSEGDKNDFSFKSPAGRFENKPFKLQGMYPIELMHGAGPGDTTDPSWVTICSNAVETYAPPCSSIIPKKPWELIPTPSKPNRTKPAIIKGYTYVLYPETDQSLSLISSYGAEEQTIMKHLIDAVLKPASGLRKAYYNFMLFPAYPPPKVFKNINRANISDAVLHSYDTSTALVCLHRMMKAGDIKWRTPLNIDSAGPFLIATLTPFNIFEIKQLEEDVPLFKKSTPLLCIDLSKIKRDARERVISNYWEKTSQASMHSADLFIEFMEDFIEDEGVKDIAAIGSFTNPSSPPPWFSPEKLP